MVEMGLLLLCAMILALMTTQEGGEASAPERGGTSAADAAMLVAGVPPDAAETPAAEVTPEAAPDAAIEAITAKHRGEMARTARALQNLQAERDDLVAENETLRGQRPEKLPVSAAPRQPTRDDGGRFAPKPEATADEDVARVLAALRKDEDGNIFIGNAAYDADIAQTIIAAQVKADRAESRVNAFLDEQRTQAEQRQIAVLGEQLVNQAQAYIGDLVSDDKAIPQARRSAFQRRAIQAAAAIFDDAVAQGEKMTDALVIRACQDAVKAEKDYLTFPAALQAADNAAHAAQYPVRPGGGAGVTAPVNLDQLTRSQKMELAKQARIRAEAASTAER